MGDVGFKRGARICLCSR